MILFKEIVDQRILQSCDWPCLGMTLIKLHWFVPPMDICPKAKKSNLTTQTFLELLEFHESWNLIG